MFSSFSNTDILNTMPYQDLWKLSKKYSVIDLDNDLNNTKSMMFNNACSYGNTDSIMNLNIPTTANTLPSAIANPCISKSHMNLSNHIRMLWEQHIIWTIFAIISIIEDTPYKDLVIKRLLRNPLDFEAALRPLYGNQVAKKFSDLLTSHLVIASDLVNAAKAGDNIKATDAEKKWYANAEEIADFLGSINPYWSKEVWRQMLFDHLAMTKAEAVYRLNKEYEKGINLYDEVEKQALEMADVMTEGIVKQFPQKFQE